MIGIRGPSAWSFVTSSTGGLGLEFVAVSGGAIYLTDPAGAPATLHYGGLGAGLTAGLRLPRIGKVKFSVKGRGVGAGVAPASFPNAGRVFITESCPGPELTRDDFRGVTVFVEGGGGLIAGLGGTAMLMGINSAEFLAALALPGGSLLLGHAISQARAVLVAGGLNAGLQAGAGIAAFGGYLR